MRVVTDTVQKCEHVGIAKIAKIAKIVSQQLQAAQIDALASIFLPPVMPAALVIPCGGVDSSFSSQGSLQDRLTTLLALKKARASLTLQFRKHTSGQANSSL
jgi:hypothetical protein